MRLRSLFMILAVVFWPAFAAHALVSIDGVGDVNFGSWSGSGPLTSSPMSICVYNGAGSTYGIRATGSGPGFSFALQKGSTDLEFAVSWRDNSGDWEDLDAGTPSPTFSGASQVVGCGGSSNAAARFQISAERLQSVSAGSYSGSVSFELMPR